MNYDILIIGGGVIGLSIARELGKRKIGRVAIVERGRVGQEASYAAAGMLAPNAENEVVNEFYRMCDASRQMFPELAAQLLEETAIDTELDRSGTLYAAFTEEDADHLGARFARQVEAGIPVQRLSPSETREAEPHISALVRESLFFPNDWQVENRKLVQALHASVRNLGIEIIEGTSVASLWVEKGRVSGVCTTESRFAAGTTVLATGAWTSLIKIEDEPVPIKVNPIRGQMISFHPAEKMFNRVVYSPRGYLVPRADGRILIGATVEDVGFNCCTTAAALDRLQAAGEEIAPGLAKSEIAESWAGLRPFAANGLPIIGPVPDYEGLFVATAHYRNGILLAPITAKLVADQIVSGLHLERELNAKA